MKPNVLLFDIETKPILSYTWGLYEQDVISVKEHSCIICFAHKWLGGKIEVKGLVDCKDKQSDRELIKDVWELFNKADIIVAQNGDEFDIKKVNARFSYYNFPPPSPYKTIDTLKQARKNFGFESNKLDDLGEYLGLGRKIKHEGIEMWLGCMRGEKKWWDKMKRYNKQDIRLLEKVYLRIRPFIKNPPNLSVFLGLVCPKCGSKDLQVRGFSRTQTGAYRRFYCNKCYGWAQSPYREKGQRVIKSI